MAAQSRGGVKGKKMTRIIPKIPTVKTEHNKPKIMSRYSGIQDSKLSNPPGCTLDGNGRHEQWISQYGRVYKDDSEKATPDNIFKENVARIAAFNSQTGKSYKLVRVWGCNVGLMDEAFKFIEQNKGLTAEANYPYKGTDGPCNANKAASHAAKITGFEDVPANSEAALMKAVARQPVSVSIDAGGFDFQLYSSGIFAGSCDTQLDHGVAAVGYGVSDGSKYWLVKNSWGAQWGEEEYIRMQKDISAKEGLCGIAMQASYPTA
ncbi:hypothetical protein DKX38_011449 [Salix brachista]|uniref:Peptidase C1A papain C-terminal domain-containing protein n=1 Tax=Salix brachista TaxID=2182728 RepID=A0A5N5M1F8_9ROSI|nr:hypothetical protein DKX38_011449 [Salix brachista]